MLKKSLVYLTYITAALFLLEGLVIFAVMPLFQIRSVTLDNRVIEDKKLLSLAGIEGNEYYFLLDEEEIRQKLESHHLIRKAIVHKGFPDSLNIVVYGRKAVAVSYINKGDLTIPVCFDEKGVVFEMDKGVADLDLPVISGDIDFTGIGVGGRLPDVITPLLKQLKELRRDEPLLYGVISELTIRKKGAGTFDILLALTNKSVKVEIENSITKELVKHILLVTDLLDSKNISLETIDFRTNEVVYTTKE